MKLRRISAFTALASVIVAAGSFTVAGADAPFSDLGQKTVGATLTFPFSCTTANNHFFLFLNPDTPQAEKKADLLFGTSTDLPLGYMYDTTGLEPGVYGVGIECADAANGVGIWDFAFTLVPVDPCAPVDTTEVPKGPSRAPHGVLPVCETTTAPTTTAAAASAGIPTTGSSGSTNMLMLGTLAILTGGGLLIARRRVQA